MSPTLILRETVRGKDGAAAVHYHDLSCNKSGPQRQAERAQLDRVEPALPDLHLADERLALTELLGQLHLGQSGRRAGLLEEIRVSLARQMYEARDFSAMQILADALQDAGCDNEDVPNHCRNERVHVRGCWVVDLILGKD